MNRKITLYTEIPGELLIKQLKAKTYEQTKFSYKLWVDENSKHYLNRDYYGVIYGMAFKLVRVIYGKNFFTPLLFGQIISESEHTRIEICVKDSPYMKLTYICLLVIYCANLLLFFTTMDVVCVLSIIINTLILLTFVLTNNYYINRVMREIETNFHLN